MATTEIDGSALEEIKRLRVENAELRHLLRKHQWAARRRIPPKRVLSAADRPATDTVQGVRSPQFWLPPERSF